jgi:hypothetical protein
VTKILVTGMADSIHLARWLAQFKLSNFHFVIISSSPHRKVHPQILELIASSGQNGSARYEMPWISRAMSLPMWILDRFTGDLIRGALILWTTRRHKPEFIHVNELQNAGYATLRAYEMSGRQNFPPVFSTNYGSELVWFQKYKSHAKRLRKLMGISTAFSAECLRDYRLAREFGFTGVEMPLMPVAGGGRFSPPAERVEGRKTIAVKGYQNKWGRALTVLSVLEKLHKELAGYTVEVFSSNSSVVKKCRELQSDGRLNVICHKKGTLSHPQMMELFARSEIYIGFSMSDGISTSMIEAMANGAIPIQTCTSCADEWVVTGKTGFILDPSDELGLAKSVLSIVNGDFDAAAARTANAETISRRYDPSTLKQIALNQYDKMLTLDK